MGYDNQSTHPLSTHSFHSCYHNASHLQNTHSRTTQCDHNVPYLLTPRDMHQYSEWSLVPCLSAVFNRTYYCQQIRGYILFPNIICQWIRYAWRVDTTHMITYTKVCLRDFDDRRYFATWLLLVIVILKDQSTVLTRNFCVQCVREHSFTPCFSRTASAIKKCI